MADYSDIFKRKKERDIYTYGLYASHGDTYGRDDTQEGYTQREDLQTLWLDDDSQISDLSDEYHFNEDFHSEESYTVRNELLQEQDKIYMYQLRQENIKLKLDLEKSQDELNKLKEELDKVHKSHYDKLKDNRYLDTERVSTINQLKHSIRKLQEQINKLHVEKQTLGADVRREKMNFNISENKIKRLQKTFTREKEYLESANKRLRNDHIELDNKVQMLQKEKDELTTALRLARKHGENEKTELEQMRRERKLEREYFEHDKSNERKPGYVRLQNFLVQSTDENTSVTASKEVLGKLIKENSELKDKVSQLLKFNTNLSNNIRNKADNENNNESFENLRLREKNKELQEEVGRLDRKIVNLERDLMQEKENAKNIKKECFDLQKMLTHKNEDQAIFKTFDDKKRQLCEKISELEHKVEQLSKDKTELTENLQHARNTVNENGYFENSKLLDKNQNLQKEVKELRHEIQHLKENIMSEEEKLKIKEKEFRHLQQTMNTVNEENLRFKTSLEREKILNERNAELRQLLEERKSRSEDVVRAKDTRKKSEIYSNTYIQELNEALQKKVGQLENENQRLKENLQQEKENVKKLEDEHGKRTSIMIKEMEKQQQEIIRLKANLGDNDDRSSKVDSRVNKKFNADKDIQQQLKHTTDQLKQIQKELDDTKSRLSRAMGDRLTDNNPNIADLSDKNRPTKISERYQELYDNQWTDAFEIANGTYMNEEKSIHILRDILMDTLEFCKTQAANQMNQIKTSFLKGEDFPANMNKQVKDCRKAMAEQYGKGLYREYCDHLKTAKPGTMSTPSYVKECFEICWLMAVQDPPVVFGPDIRRGDTFNKEHYKAYTRSGERVEFVVWPVLLLHQDGPVLCKGVAQGR